jgi:DNA-directed RNA polymerase specialized sigma24 family protein
MTREEFDPWLEQHYADLVAAARRLLNTLDDAQEAVQQAVLQTLASGRLGSVHHPWTWMTNAVRGTAANLRRGTDRARKLRRAVKSAQRAGLHHGWRRPAPRAE